MIQVVEALIKITDIHSQGPDEIRRILTERYAPMKVEVLDCVMTRGTYDIIYRATALVPEELGKLPEDSDIIDVLADDIAVRFDPNFSCEALVYGEAMMIDARLCEYTDAHVQLRQDMTR